MAREPSKRRIYSVFGDPDHRGAIRSFLANSFRWLDLQIRGFYSAVGLFLAIGFALALLSLFFFVWLAEGVMEGETRRFDEAILLWIHQHASDRLDIVALEITALGDGAVVLMLVLVTSVVLWLTRFRHLAVTLWVATLGGMLMNTALKLSFDRPRPRLFEWRTEYAGLSSFPSGHATTAAIVYCTLAYVIARLEPAPAMRRVVLGIFLLLILLIGLSRLYLGVHYPSDVIAGYAVGFAWTTFSVLGVEAVRRSRGIPEPEPGDVHVED